MTVSKPAFELLNSFTDPVLLTDVKGTIHFCNRSAKRLLYANAVGRPLGDFLAGDPGALSKSLKSWAGTRTPLPGALELHEAKQPSIKIQCFGSRTTLDAPAGGKLILIHFNDVQSQRLNVLKTSLRSLQDEVKERRHAQALAEEALADRELMLRELQHRVKNNIQVVTTLVRSAIRETTSAEARKILAETYTRLSATTSVQQLLYQTDEFRTVDAGQILQNLVSELTNWFGREHIVNVHADGIALSNNTVLPVALIVNELLTNSIKYGRSAKGFAEVSISLTKQDKRFTLCVADNGAGFTIDETATRRASGLGLVRGFVRQLGGSFRMNAEGGVCAVIEFEVDD